VGNFIKRLKTKRAIAIAASMLILGAIAVVLLGSATATPLCTTGSGPGVTSVCVEVLMPDGSPVTCGSTVDTGELIARGFATGTNAAQNVTWRMSYFANGSGGGDWYTLYLARLNTVQTKMAELVQDFSAAQANSSVSFAFAQKAGLNTPRCDVFLGDVSSIPGEISERTVQTTALIALSVELRNYADGTPFPCGGVAPGGRIAGKLFATAPSAGLYDMHMHEERPLPLGTGPNQDQMFSDQRWWEMAMFRVPVGTSSTKVVDFVSQLNGSQGGGMSTVHWGQQALDLSPNVQPFTMCHFDT